MIRYLIAAFLFAFACTPRQVIQQVPVPEKVIIKYLPAETVRIVDSVYTESQVVRDTVQVTKTRWRETVKEKRVIDTVPKYIIRNDTVTVEKKIPAPAWKYWLIGILGFVFGASILVVIAGARDAIVKK